jgi:hypothetical protein
MDDQNRDKILSLLDQRRILSLATLRPDGWPVSTTVGLCPQRSYAEYSSRPGQPEGRELAKGRPVALTIDRDTPQSTAITVVPMVARPRPASYPTEVGKVLRLLMAKYPEYTAQAQPMAPPEQVRVHRQARN